MYDYRQATPGMALGWHKRERENKGLTYAHNFFPVSPVGRIIDKISSPGSHQTYLDHLTIPVRLQSHQGHVGHPAIKLNQKKLDRTLCYCFCQGLTRNSRI